MSQAGLFAEPVIAGLDYRDDIMAAAEHDALVEWLEALELAPFRFGQWTGNRKTISFGWRYDFEDASFAPAEPLPQWLVPLQNHAAAFAQAAPNDFVHALIARYDPGAGIGWHRDRDVFEKVVGFSLNTPATLRFRQRTGTGFKRASLDVAPRSAYLLSGEARSRWEHSIAPGEQLRFSITFRTLSEKGRRIAEAQRIS
jgi:alkylated DNA repair dioxygenase AlkB